MPYIGQRPATGEANSFKILDEISSFTLTFDGSSAGVVSVANDTITEREHRFVTGQRVTYNDGGGTAITGLSDGVYYIIVEDRHTFKLASSANNAASGTAINLTGLGVGASHTLNVAFDGVNTKFKATHTNGTRAGISQSGQLMLSINGVIQEPHDNTDSPSTGYATDHTSTIIFSAAPASTDQFFGRLIATNAPTFDISDNIVDNFTGDGSTSTFTLSKTPPNNESVLVTIDGVVQYPDDTSAVRAYTVAENILSFVSAPGLAVEIQVRHIGFAGASTGGISGFYGRTGNAVLKSTDNIVLNNATASGTVQAANVTVTGDLTVNGTTTTLDTDLIGVDKLEVAANNTTVAAAITQTGSGDILNLYDGASEVFSVADGGGVTITDSIIHSGDTNTKIRFPAADTVTVETAGSEALRITSTGRQQSHAGYAGVGINTFASWARTGGAVRAEVGYNAVTTDYMYFGTGTNHPLALRVNNSNALYIKNDANRSVGIGTDNPARKLEIFDTAATVLQLNSTNTGGTSLRIQNSGTDKMYMGLAGDFITGQGSNVTDSAIRASGSLLFASGGGTERLRITSSGEIVSTNGTLRRNVSDSSFTVSGDTASNTGANINLYGASHSSLANVFRVRIGASEKLRIDSNGRLGLGAFNNSSYDSIGQNFLIANESSHAGMTIRSGGSGAFGAIHFADGVSDNNEKRAGRILYGHDDNFMSFHTANAEKLRITSAGSVLVGGVTTDNGFKLKVSDGGGYEFAFAPNDGGINSLVNYNRSGGAYVDCKVVQKELQVWTGTSPVERLRITSDGDMGLGNSGCSNPGADPAVGNAATVFEIRQTTSGNISSGSNRRGAVLRLKHEAQWENGYQNSASDDLGRVEFVTGDASTGEGVRSIIRCRNLQYYNNQALTFEVAESNSSTIVERLRISSDGDIGISDSAPTRKLSINGSMNLSSGSRIESYSSGGNLIIQGGSTYPGGHLKMYGGSGDDKIEFCTSGVSASSTVRLRLESNGSIRLTPEGSTANPNARIDTSGDNLRLVTMKDGSGGCGFIIETQHSGVVGERLRIASDGNATFKHKVNIGDSHTGGEILSVGKSSGTSYMSFHTGGANMGFIGYADQLISGGASNELGIRSQDDLLFATGGNTERLRVASDGELKTQLKITMRENTIDAFSFHSNGANGYFRLTDEYDNVELLRFHGDGALSINTTSLTNYSQTSNSLNTNNAGGAAGNWSWRRDNGAVIQATDADSGWSMMYLNKYEWNSGDDSRWISFYLNGHSKDTINWNGSNIIYGNASDYRIKENIRDFTSGIDKIKQLKVHLYDYIDPDRGTDHIGFIAHELQEIIPEAVSGEKDAMRKEEDTGNDVMDVQMVDHGKLTPVLTAALQEALAKIETLEAKVAALEGS